MYSRPDALLRNVDTFMNKFAHVLTPTASSLQAGGRQGEVRALLLETARYAFCLALPPLLMLAVLGDAILLIWMGPRYQQGALLAVMAAGALLPLTQQPVQRILTGLDLHGRLALVSLGTAVVGVTASLLAVGTFGGSLIAAALALALPHALGNGLFVGLYACRRLDVPVREYVWRAWVAPLLYVLPFALSLVVIRVWFAGRPGAAIMAGLLAGALILPPVYWNFLLSDAARQALRRRLGLSAAPSAA